MSAEDVWSAETQEAEEEEDFDSEFKTFDDHVLVLVDARPDMFQPMDNGEVPFYNAMQLTLHLMKTKVVTSDRHTVGVTFFGTRESKCETAGTNDHIYVFQTLDTPTASRIKQVQDLASQRIDFEQEIGSADQRTCPLKSAIWSCTQAFHQRTRSKHADFKRIWLITNDDSPLRGDAEEEDKVVQVAKDAAETGIEIFLWQVNRPGHRFNPNRFYSRLLVVDEDADPAERMASFDNLEEMLQSAKKKEHYKRRLTTIPFVLADPGNGQEFSFNVQVYKPLALTKKPYSINLDRRTNQPIKVTTKLLCETTGAYLDELQVRTYMELGGKRVYIDRDAVKELKRLGDPGLKLLYFAPRTMLPDDYNISSGYFIFPDEGSTRGSAAAFYAFLQCMLERNLIGIGRLVRGKVSRPRLVAILPQAEEDDGPVGRTPGGMHVVILPYASEVRDAPLDVGHASEEQILAAEQVVNALQLEEFDCRDFPNPGLQKFYSDLQAIALNQDKPEWDEAKDDRLQPDEEGHEAAADQVQMLKAALDIEGVDLEEAVQAAKPKKRAAGGDKTASTAKRARNAANDGEVADIRALVASGALNKSKVPELKEMCKTLGLPVSGTKQVLIDRIMEACS